MNFREFLNEKINKSGTYVAVKWPKSTAKILLDAAKEYGVPNLISLDEIHTTVIYSRVEFNHKPSTENYHFSLVGPNNDRSSRLHVFENKELNHKALVLKIYSKQLEDRHKEIMKNNPNATYDFDEYIPHITLSYDIEDYDITNFDYVALSEKLETVSGGIEYTEKLNLEKYKKDKNGN